MKREKVFSCLIAAVLAFCISFGGVACIATGFSLTGADGPVSMSQGMGSAAVDLGSIAGFCVLFSAVAALCFANRYSAWALTGVLALLAGYLWHSGALEISAEALLYRITYIYDQGYGWGVLRWTDEFPPSISPDLGFCAIAAVIALLVVWTVCCRHNAIAAVAVGFVPLVACLVVTDTVPAAWCLFLLLIGQVLLILTNTVRRQDAVSGNRLTAMLLVPAMLFLLLLFWAVPREGYEAVSTDMQQKMLAWLQELPIAKMLKIGYSDAGSGSLDLTSVGPKLERRYTVMNVTAAESGTLYLRGQALDVYDGKSWTASKASSGYDGGWPSLGMIPVGTVAVSTVSSHDALYFPYYPSGGQWPADKTLQEGMLVNPSGLRTYSFTQKKVSEGSRGSVSLSNEMRDQCLKLPPRTKSEAMEHLRLLGISDVIEPRLSGFVTRDRVDTIGNYIRASAQYDLNTEAMPGSEDDFAMWFLNSSETGYCIHFASAATVLLRAAGIPARYVSGYIVDGVARKEVTVTANRAHAWVEYYDPDWGWRVLETTPGYYDEDPVVPTDPSESTEPTDPGTEPSTEPTTEPTQPDDTPTMPTTEPTEPSGDPQGNGDPQKSDLDWLWTVIQWIGIVLGVWAVIVGQYLLRQRLRSKRMRTGHPNQRALARWRMVLRMSRLIKEEPPEALYELAEKAKFSQHTLTVGERMEFDRYLDHADGRLNELRWFKRWMIRLIWAV